MFEEQWCSRCVHYGPEEGPGCPVWLTHLLYAYEECNSESNAKSMLDILIVPREITASDGLPILTNECQMFVEAEPNVSLLADREEQLYREAMGRDD